MKPPNTPGLLILLLVCTGISACAVQSVYNRDYISQDLEHRTGFGLPTTPLEEGFVVPATINLDDGLSEDEAVMMALWNNAQFQTDLADLGFSRADLIEAGQLSNPVLSLLFPLGPKQLEATLVKPLSSLWLRPNRVAIAKIDAERLADNLVQHGLRLILDTRLAHVDLIQTNDLALLAEEKSQLLAEIASIYEARLRAGDISELGVAPLRTEALQARADAVSAEYNAGLAHHRIRALLGMGMENTEIKAVGRAIPGDVQPDTTALLQTALAARPDLRAAELAIEAAGKKVGLERARIFNLIGILDANAKGKEGFEMGPGLQWEIPLFSQNKAGITRAQAELEKAMLNYVTKQQAIILEVQEASNQWQSSSETLSYWHSDIVPSLENALEQTEAAYRSGETSFLSVLEKRRQLVEAQIHEINAIAAMRNAQSIVSYSVGSNVHIEN